MLKNLEVDLWDKVFEYASFGRDDVEEIIASSVGELHVSPWLMLVRLKNGVYGYLKANCYYTGWVYKDEGEGFSETDSELKRLIKMKIGKEERSRLGLNIPEDSLVNL